MTNAAIIENMRFELMNEGILKSVGKAKAVDEAGNSIEVDIPEEIHTYEGWKARGFQVKKGEKSKIKFTIWKQGMLKELNDKGEPTGNQIEGRMFMKLSAFFTPAQVEPLKTAAD